MRTRSATTKTTRAPHPGQLLLAAAAATLTFLLAPAQASATSAPHATSPSWNCAGSSPTYVSCTSASGMEYEIAAAIGDAGGGSVGASWTPAGAAASNGGTFTSITGTWVEPVFPPSSVIAIWPGIQGDTLVQAGTASPAWGFAPPYVWAYDYPTPGQSPTGYTGPPVEPGDTITVILTRLSSSSWQVYVSDKTAAGQTYSGTWTENWSAGQVGNSPLAEWETEAGPGDNGLLNCSVDWLAASATTSGGFVINAIGPLQAAMKENPYGFCPTALPAVTSISPSSGPPAGGTVVTITGTSLSGATAVDFGDVPATSFTVDSPTEITAITPPEPSGISVGVTVTTPSGVSAAPADFTYTPPPPPTCDPSSPPVGPVVSLAPDEATGGYWMATPFGEVISCHAPFMGSPASLSAPITAITPTPHGHGYWLVASDGGVFAYGSAQFFGSLPGLPASAEPHSPVVSLVPTANANGYYEVTANGDVYAFGAAPFYGSMGGVSLAKPVVGAALDPETGGYWLVASDGGVFAFHAPFYGSMGGKYLAKPVVGMSYAPSTGGYRLVASDGGVFSFDAPFHGSMGGQALAKPVVAIATTPGGYWEVGSDGGVFCFGSAPFEGSLG